MNKEPKYKVGDFIKVGHWCGETEPLEILDIKQTWHHRLQEYCWGYKMNGDTHLTMLYVPEGYLRPELVGEDNDNCEDLITNVQTPQSNDSKIKEGQIKHRKIDANLIKCSIEFFEHIADNTGSVINEYYWREACGLSKEWTSVLVGEDFELDFYTQLDLLIATQSNDKALDFMFDTIDDLCLAEKFDEVNDIIKNFKLTKYSGTVIFGMLTITNSWRNKLHERQRLIDYVKITYLNSVYSGLE